jgi:hypothetical protein
MQKPWDILQDKTLLFIISNRMEEDFNFDNPKSLSNYFEIENIPSEDIGKMDYNAFWHELGHLFGLLLAEANNIKLATAERIIIINNDQKICIKDDEQRLALKLNDIKKNLYYFTYLLMGGIFHLYIFVDNPTNDHFESCYTDDGLNVDFSGIHGRAGSDWSKICQLASLKQWKLSELEKLRLDIYQFLKNAKIFECLKPKVEELYKEFKNKQIIEGEDLIKSEEKLKEVFTDIPKFTSEFHNKIIKRYSEEFKVTFANAE